MNILQIIPYRFWGGPEIQTFQMASLLQNSSSIRTLLIIYFSHHCTPQDLESLRSKAQSYNLQFELRRSPSFMQIFSEFIYLKKYLQDFNISKVVSSGYLANLLVVFLPIYKISFVHGWTNQSFKISIYEKLDRFLLRYFDAIACVSQQQYQILILINSNVKIVANSFYSHANESLLTKEDLLSRLQLKPTVQIIMTVGRLSQEKGHLWAISAIQKLVIRNQDIHWVILGDGDQKNSLLKEIKHLKMEKNIHLLGHVHEAYRYINCADIFLLPSFREGMPVVLIEAMSLKVPVIATSIGGNTELIEHNVTGLLVEPQQIEQLIETVSWAQKNTNAVKNMTIKAHQKIEKNYNPQKQVQSWKELLKYDK
jgi:glycosyltransferase involved in cell wall biosynthesis